MTKPLLLLDIDGVLNFRGPLTSPYHYETSYREFRLHLDVRHHTWIEAATGLFDVVWASMWQDLAVSVFAPLFGFGEDLPYVRFTDHAEPVVFDVGTMKLPGIKVAARDRPTLWIDDDADHPRVREWVSQRNQSIPTRLIVTDPDVGLTSVDVRTAVNWARSLAVGTSAA